MPTTDQQPEPGKSRRLGAWRRRLGSQVRDALHRLDQRLGGPSDPPPTRATAGAAGASGDLPTRKTGSGHKRMIWIAGFALLALELINASARFKQSHGSLWSLFLAIGAFLYLWWLASLLFDLVFVWHRYVQADGALQFLRKEIRPSDFHASGDDDRPDGGAAAELKIPPSTPGPEVSRPHEG